MMSFAFLLLHFRKSNPHRIIMAVPTLLLLFLSATGVAIQMLLIKLLAFDGFLSMYVVVAFRGAFQAFASAMQHMLMQRKNSLNANELIPIFGNSMEMKAALVGRTYFGFVAVVTMGLSAQRIPIGDTMSLVMLSPIVSALFSFMLLREPVGIGHIIAVFFALAGVMCIAKPSFLFGGGGENNSSSIDHHHSSSSSLRGQTPSLITHTIGILFAFSTALSAGISHGLIRALGTVVSIPWTHVVFNFGLGQLILGLACSFSLEDSRSLQFTPYRLVLLICGGVVGAASQVMMTIGMQKEKSLVATVVQKSEVVIGYILQVLFLGETLDAVSVIGSLLLFCGIAVIAQANAVAAFFEDYFVAVDGFNNVNKYNVEDTNTTVVEKIVPGSYNKKLKNVHNVAPVMSEEYFREEDDRKDVESSPLQPLLLQEQGKQGTKS